MSQDDPFKQDEPLAFPLPGKNDETFDPPNGAFEKPSSNFDDPDEDEDEEEDDDLDDDDWEEEDEDDDDSVL